MSKRPREPANLELVEIWEDLAHESEDIRLKAAYVLVTDHLATNGQSPTILRRLFRGLCSSRKAARLGFFVALTEVLFELSKHPALSTALSTADIIGLLRSQTAPENITSGQDERDHYIGRIFGCHAIIRSTLLFHRANLEGWQQLLNVLGVIAAKKPWLRQECGWVLFTSLQILAEYQQSNFPSETFAREILECLITNRQIRTPEGVAIWLQFQRLFPTQRLPQKIWAGENLLSRQNLQPLAQALRDAKTGAKDATDLEAQGAAFWSQNIHFVWEVVFLQLRNSTGKKQVFFDDFWQAVVAEGLFASSNSHERKHWGFLVLQKSFEILPADLLARIFTGNVGQCLVQSLKADDNNLKRSATKTIEVLGDIAQSQPAKSNVLILGLTRSVNDWNFDLHSKTRSIEKLTAAFGATSANAVAEISLDIIKDPQTQDRDLANARRKSWLNICTKMMVQQISKPNQMAHHEISDSMYLATFIKGWLSILHDPKTLESSDIHLSDEIRDLLREKIAQGFEQLLKFGSPGRRMIFTLIATIRVTAKLDAEIEVLNIVVKAWRRFSDLRKLLEIQPDSAEDMDEREGLTLLYGVILFQLYNGQAESFSLLEDVMACDNGFFANKDPQTAVTNMDVLIEVLLSFLSKPSRFLRRVAIEVFRAFASHFTPEDLQPLNEVLETKESKEGQEVLFEEEIDGVDSEEEQEGSDSSSNESEVELLGSDVEMINAMSEDLESLRDGEESSADTDSKTSESDDKSQNDTELDQAEYDALEKSLAAALGTRKITAEDVDASSSTGESDEDMGDSEMEELDAKLAEVFRNRAATTSKKKDAVNARENIINFKNRVLDLMEAYVKDQYLLATSLELAIPLLQLARQTSSKQISMRTIDLLRLWARRCKGSQNVPTLPGDAVEPAIKLLKSIHKEAGISQASNAQKSACSQMSILTVKVLIKSGVDVHIVRDIYVSTKAQADADGSRVRYNDDFFQDWLNWCQSMEDRIGQVDNKSLLSHAINDSKDNGQNNAHQRNGKRNKKIKHPKRKQ